MNITKLPINEPVLLLKEVFKSEEKFLIEKELDFLCKDYKLLGPEHTGTATDEENKPKKFNKGLFLDEVFPFRAVSDILAINRKYFSKEFCDSIEMFDNIFKYLRKSNRDHTLLSYYEENSWYKSHEDRAVLSIITYYWKEDKKFVGGDLKFTSHNYTVDISPWDVIIFPSFILHEVSPVTLLPGIEKNKLNGRVSLTTFVAI